MAYARVVQFGEMEELTELMVDPNHQGQGIGRALLEQCWPGDPTPELGRVVVATGEPTDLGLYMEFGVMPVAGHWHIRQRTDRYLERRSQEIERVETAVHVLKPDRAVDEWLRLEPPVVAHERRPLHEFLCRDRTCLATIDPDSHEATSLCWVSGEGEIGPAVGATPADIVPVVLAALDRVAATVEPEYLSLFSTTIAWWLLKRLRGLGFEIWWRIVLDCSGEGNTQFAWSQKASFGTLAPYSERMLGQQQRSARSQLIDYLLWLAALALLVLLVAAWILFKVVLGIVAFAATIIVVILAIAAIVWAIRIL